MSHDISEVMIGGRRVFEAVYANNPAWHGLGEVFDPEGYKGMNSEQAIELGHLGWTVEKEKLLLAQDNKAVKGFMGLVRQDTRDTLATVGSRYEILQNRDAFGFLDSLVQDGIMKYESAFALHGGRSVCLLARMPSFDWVVPGEDGMLRYILLSMSHGYGGINILPTSVRVVCANTQRLALGMGKKSTWTIRHSGDMQAKLKVAKQYISQFDKAFDLYRENAKGLLLGYNDKQKAEYINELFPAPAEDAGKRSKSNHQRGLDQVSQALRSRAQNVPGIKGTWWSLFNAVTEVVDHAEPLRQSRDPDVARENKFIKVMTGPGASFKDRALNLALTMAS